MSVDNIPINAHNFTFGVPAVILALTSLYLGMAHLENSIAEKPVMWLGGELLHEAKLEDFFNGIFDRFRYVAIVFLVVFLLLGVVSSLVVF